ncbi:PREDICTED: pentatricopeptide repeat-containing protein At2g25580-like [Camelina sativa]|uniref:Pentatricopeptide repeat-containing protein At2g25580-like n=1 Tax=Camelina sativa TaxID=90675 RepID=A0ABM0SWY1_CAMSA|nr:PREDICTED: pentatricopeptide repeat-containing protein At2g25580-like [Camelina sativa]
MYKKIALFTRTNHVLSLPNEKRIHQVMRNLSTAVERLDFGNSNEYQVEDSSHMMNPREGFNGSSGNGQSQNPTWSYGKGSETQSLGSNHEQPWKQSPGMSNNSQVQSHCQGNWYGTNSDYQSTSVGSSWHSGKTVDRDVSDMIREFEDFCEQENPRMALTTMEKLELKGYVMDLRELIWLSQLFGEENAFQEDSILQEAKVSVQGKIRAKVYNSAADDLKHYTDWAINELDKICDQGKVKKALCTIDTLASLNHVVDLTRLLRLAKVCGEAEALEEGKAVHGKIIALARHLDVSSYHVLLEMYSNCGLVNEAVSVFENMPERNLETWYITIRCFAKNGRGEEAIDLFSRFKKEGNKPTAQLFRGVFYSCGMLGDVDEGLLHFESMSKDYGIVPSIEDYVSLVEMYALPGFLEEAVEFVEKMPMEPNVDVWETLMNLSRVHGNLELGDQCAEFVELLDPTRLNKQSREGFLPVKASDVEKERLKKKSGVHALPGLTNRTNEFKAGDTNLPENDELLELLRNLKMHMIEVGYVADTKPALHDIDQESKETALLGHSERIAFARAVLSTAPRKQITILKNLRVCVDCHNALKVMADVVGREVIMRDAKRFHHLKNGACSCNDYW